MCLQQTFYFDRNQFHFSTAEEEEHGKEVQSYANNVKSYFVFGYW